MPNICSLKPLRSYSVAELNHRLKTIQDAVCAASAGAGADLTLNSPLTGFSPGTNTAVTSSDSVLVAFEKLQGQINAVEGANPLNTPLTGYATDSSGQQVTASDTILTGFEKLQGQMNFKLSFGNTLTGFSVGANTALASSDNILAAFGKIQGQINARISLSSPITGYTLGTNTALAATDTLLAALGKIQGQINNRILLSSTLAGYVVGANTALAASDTILAAFGKVQGQINARVGANPTGTAGLTAVNGVATTYMRSDAAPAINQAITPTWTGEHRFTFSSTQSAPTVQLSAVNAQLDVMATGGAVDSKRWNFAAGNTSFTFRTLNDAGSTASNIWALTRSGNEVSLQNWYIANVSKMALGPSNFETFVPNTVVTGTDGNKIWLAKYVSGTGHTDAPKVLGATSTYLQIGGREYGSLGFAGIGFGYVSAATDHPCVWIGHEETATAGNTTGDLVIATRSATTNTAPVEAFRVTSTRDILAATGYVPANPLSLTTKQYVDSAAPASLVTGYQKLQPNPIAATDSILTALGKLEGQTGESITLDYVPPLWTQNGLPNEIIAQGDSIYLFFQKLQGQIDGINELEDSILNLPLANGGTQPFQSSTSNQTMYLTGGGTAATFTVTIPPSSATKTAQILRIAPNQAITALTLQGTSEALSIVGGAPAGLAAGEVLSLQRVDNLTWIKL